MGVMVLSRLNGRVSAPLCHSIGGHLLSLVSTWLEHRVEGPEPVQWFKCMYICDRCNIFYIDNIENLSNAEILWYTVLNL